MLAHSSPWRFWVIINNRYPSPPPSPKEKRISSPFPPFLCTFHGNLLMEKNMAEGEGQEGRIMSGFAKKTEVAYSGRIMLRIMSSCGVGLLLVMAYCIL